MRYLLDTNVWIWLQTAPHRIPAATFARLADHEATVLLSAVSSWEIAIKWSLGMLPLPEPPGTYIPSRMRHDAVDALPITHVHTLQVATLPHHHGDPFDRLLIAQAQLEGIPIVTADRQIPLYDVEVLPA
jgi:PIN domain nuclease of toxin-antitoxin system